MAMNINQDYNQFYKESVSVKHYGANNIGEKKDTLVKYEFNTADEQGNKVMDKMSKEETLQAMKTISKQYAKNVIVEFSGDGMAALIESRKGMPNHIVEGDLREVTVRQESFDKAVVQVNQNANDLPAYCGIYDVDKTIATAIEYCSKEEKAFVYDIVRQNFLVGESSLMSEEERQANISLGMKKAEYAVVNFISEENKKSFLDAMESVAQLASAGKADENGQMNYGVNKANYLGHGSNLVYTTNTLDMMQKIDSNAYAEYQKISNESSDTDRPLNTLKYMINWVQSVANKNPDMVNKYEEQSNQYVEQVVKNQQLDTTFENINVESKSAFIESLKVFQANNPDFLAATINRELAISFW